MSLASGSGFFLQGIRNILRNEDSITILSEASNVKEVEKCLVEIKPDFLFLDNRAIKLTIKKLLNLISKKSPGVRVILFDNNGEGLHKPQSKNKANSSDIIYLNKEINSSKLIEIIKTQTTIFQLKRHHSRLTKMASSQK